MPVNSLSAKVLQRKEQQTAEESHVQRAGTNASCCTGRNRRSLRGVPSEIDRSEQKLTCLGLILTSSNRQTALGFPLQVIFHHSLEKGFSSRLTLIKLQFLVPRLYQHFPISSARSSSPFHIQWTRNWNRNRVGNVFLYWGGTNLKYNPWKAAVKTVLLSSLFHCSSQEGERSHHNSVDGQPWSSINSPKASD